MMRTKSTAQLILAAALIMALLSAFGLLAGSSRQMPGRPDVSPEWPVLHLKVQSLQADTHPGNLRRQFLEGNMSRRPDGQPDVSEYALVQFGRPVGDEDRQILENAGAKILGYVPDFAFLVHLSAGAAERIVQNDKVILFADYAPGFKVEPQLRERAEMFAIGHAGSPRGTADVLINLHPGVDVDALVRDFARLGGRNFRDIATDELKTTAVATVSETSLKDFITQASHLEGVAWMEKKREYAVDNAYAGATTQSGTQSNTSGRTIWDKGIHGEGQIVGVGDTGIDYDMCFFRDASVAVPMNTTNQSHRKIVGYFNKADGKDLNSSGHGSHVCGSVAGENTFTTATSANGMAYKAKLAFTDIGGSGDSLAGIPSNLNTGYFPEPYNAGARIHSNSWGSGDNSYSSMSRDVDQFMWNNKQFLVLFAAGNDGPNANTVGEPGTCKSCVTVGAHDSYSTSGNPNNMAYFSSHGPTSDGRMKPEVTAPGNEIISADSDGSTTTNNCGTLSMPGTSMATPVTAGSTALIRQYFTEGWYPSGTKTPANALTPSAALMKAMLINSAVNMTGSYTADSGSGTKNIPSMGQGWGRIRLDEALYFAGEARKLQAWDSGSATTGSNWTQNVTVNTGASVKFTLVWSDYPGTVGSGKALVNDLDLTVSGPSGTFKGNVFGTGGQSATGGSADRLNPAEQVVISTPSAGTYTITVNGYTVPNGPQPFAVVVTGNVGSGGGVTTYSISGSAGTAGATLTLSGASSGSTTADGSGNYSFTGLLNGSYTITPSKSATSFSPTSRNVTVASANVTGQNFTATFNGGQVLLVDDDKGKTYETYFTAALNASGYTYNTWNVQSSGAPDLATLNLYSAVVWNVGDDYTDTLAASDETNLTSYVNGGKKLMFCGQDYLYHRGASSTFDTDILGVASFTNDTKATNQQGTASDPISNGMALTLTYPSGYTDYSDTLVAGTNATVIFKTSDNKNGGLKKTVGASGKTVFLAFPFEAIAAGANPNNKETVMKKSLDWLLGGGAPPATYSVSGTVVGPGGTGLASTTVSYSGAASGSVSTTSTGAYTISGLAAGSYTLTPSKAGYTFTPVSRSVSVSSANVTGQNFTGAAVTDTTAPDTSITAGPSGTITVADASFTWTGTDNVTATGSLQYSYQMDGGAWSAYGSATTTNYTGLTNGSHTFNVRARDAAGNVDATPATRTFTVSVSSTTVLTSGTPVSTSVAINTWKYFSITVPAGATQLQVAITNLTADVDLYTRFNALPDASNWLCRPYATGTTSEVCTQASPSAGTWYFGVYGYAAGNFKITATVQTSTTQPLISTVAASSSVSLNAYKYYQITVPSGTTNLTVTLTGLSADIDLYTRSGALPTTATYTCASEAGGTTSETCSHTNPAAGVWYIGAYGFAAGNFTVTATMTP